MLLALIVAGCGTSVARCPKARGTCPSTYYSTYPPPGPSPCPPQRACPWLEPRASTATMSYWGEVARAGASDSRAAIVKEEVIVIAPVEQESAPPLQETQGQAATVVELTDEMRYQPSQIIIPLGGTAEWKNVSQLTHTVTADPALAAHEADVLLPEGATPLNSGNILPRQTFVHSFPVPGTYRYFCIPHEVGGMIGEIIVREAAQQDSSVSSMSRRRPRWSETFLGDERTWISR